MGAFYLVFWVTKQGPSPPSTLLDHVLSSNKSFWCHRPWIPTNLDNHLHLNKKRVNLHFQAKCFVVPLPWKAIAAFTYHIRLSRAHAQGIACFRLKALPQWCSFCPSQLYYLKCVCPNRSQRALRSVFCENVSHHLHSQLEWTMLKVSVYARTHTHTLSSPK